MRGEHHYEHGPTGGYKERVPGTPNHCVPQRVELQFCQQQSTAAPLKAALSCTGEGVYREEKYETRAQMTSSESAAGCGVTSAVVSMAR